MSSQAESHRGGVRFAAPPATRPAGQRFCFTLALVTLFLASAYGAIVLLTRVTPALFPGKQLAVPVVIKTPLNVLPGKFAPVQPGASSSFNKRITVLFIGVDRRPGTPLETPFNTDSLMVGTIDPLAKQLSVVSFPRDMWIDIHNPNGGSFKGRINASYAYGLENDPEHRISSGANQLIRDMKANFDIEIDHWVWMDIQGVEGLIDSLGGVDVTISDELAVPEWWYSDDDRTDPHWVEFPPGTYHLNGYDSVAFGRYRDDSDYNRVKRQQLILIAAVQRVFKANLLSTNPVSLYNSYKDLVHTDVSDLNVIGYTSLLKDTAGAMKLYSVADPVDGRPSAWGELINGASVVLWDPANVEYWINQTFTKAIYAKSSVEIQNGFGDGGEARLERLGRYLQYEKFLPDIQLGPDAAERPDTQIILYTPDRRPMAEDIAGWLGLPKTAIVEQERQKATDPDLVIVIGKDIRLPS